MDAPALRALQSPLKQRYRETPGFARVVARAEAKLDPARLACVVPVWHSETIAGLHPATGGTGDLACSADMLVQALAACAGVTLCAVATSLNVPLRGGRVIADGVWGARGTLGVDRTVPVGLTDLVIRFELDTPADDALLESLVRRVEQYCVILQSLRAHPRVVVTRFDQPRT